MSNAITMSLAALAACALFACADGSDDGSSTTSETSPNEPTALIDENGGQARGPRTTDQREDLESANGAAARAISYNHPEPHTLSITALELSSGRAGVFELSLGGGALGELHTHQVMLDAQQLAAIRDGAELSVESGAGGSKAHTHTVTIGRR